MERNAEMKRLVEEEPPGTSFPTEKDIKLWKDVMLNASHFLVDFLKRFKNDDEIEEFLDMHFGSKVDMKKDMLKLKDDFEEMWEQYEKEYR